MYIHLQLINVHGGSMYVADWCMWQINVCCRHRRLSITLKWCLGEHRSSSRRRRTLISMRVYIYLYICIYILEVLGPYGSLSSSPYRGLACCTFWGPLGPHWSLPFAAICWLMPLQIAPKIKTTLQYLSFATFGGAPWPQRAELLTLKKT